MFLPCLEREVGGSWKNPACQVSPLLTALGHHALLRLGYLRLAHRAISWAHLDHAVALLHAHPARGAAFVPLAPLGHQTAAGS